MKLGKAILKILLLLIEMVLVFLIVIAFAIRTSKFQTYLGQQVTNYLSKELDKDLSIDKIDIIFFDQVDLKGIFAEDKFGDTLLFSDAINVQISDWNLDSLYFEVEEVNLKSTKVYLKKAIGDSTLNFQHLIDYFASSEKDTSTTSFGLAINHVILENIQFKFQDFNGEPVSNGLDYANLNIQDFNGEINNIKFINSQLQADLTQLSFIDHSGLKVNKIGGHVSYDSTLIALSQFDIELNQSHIHADHLELVTTNGAADFSDFINKVTFNSKIDSTKINLKDLAFFVPQVIGMTDDIFINNVVITGPINGMRLNQLDIELLSQTAIRGNFHIPDLSNLESTFFNQKIALFRTSVKDIERVNLAPFLEGQSTIDLPKNLKALSVIELKDGHFTGLLSDFVVDGDLYTGLGNISSENGLKFEKKNDGKFYYQGALNNKLAKDVIVENLDLRTLTQNSNLGMVNGFLQILPGSNGFSNDDINLLFEGKFTTLELNNYNYNNVSIKNGKYHDERLDGIIDIIDANLALRLNGYLDFKSDLFFNFDIKIDSALLANLNLIEGIPSINLKTDINVNLSGSSLDNIKGDIQIAKLDYFDGNNRLDIEDLKIVVNRLKEQDQIVVNSKYFDTELTGKFNFAYLYQSLNNQLANLIPNLLESIEVPTDVVQDYRLTLILKDISPILNFVDPMLDIASGTQLEMSSSSVRKQSDVYLISKHVNYDNRQFKGINLANHLDSLSGEINYNIATFQLNDSIHVDSFAFVSKISKNNLTTNLGWNSHGGINPAFLAFETTIAPNSDIITQFSPSYFHLQDSKWDIESESEVLWNKDHIDVTNLYIRNNKHLVGLNGKVSHDPNDWLNVIIEDFDLSELNGFLGGGMTLNGNLNLKGKISDVYNDIKFAANSNVKALKVNDEIVGDVKLEGYWDKLKNAVGVKGNLTRDKIETLDFEGFYYANLSKNNLDLEINFDHTNIAFLNAFSDPELYTNIRGNIDGKLDVKGELDNPIIVGHLNVEKTKVSVPMFNVDYELNGLLNFEKGEILADYLEIRDELGNLGVGMMQIYHKNYAKWSYDVTLDFEDPNITKTFLAMNTVYTEGAIYFGKAFITGNVNIFGYGDLTEINVDLKTQKGTNLTLPLYGTEETEENSFVRFYNPDTAGQNNLPVQIDRLGMTLAMNFEVTNDAKVNLVFDPVLNDQIEARGAGEIEINMDDIGDISMFGKYTINEGVYNFNMKNIVTEQFEIIDGSTLIWTQSPYDAVMDIKTRFKRQVDMSDIMIGNVGGSSKKDLVYGYLNLSEKLSGPKLTLDIEAPEARDEAKNALNQIRGIEDDLNKQFFSLLLLKKFIPIQGATTAGGSVNNVTEDLVNQQINSVLGQIGENYNLNSDIGTDHAELGFSTSFLNDKLKITSSVGVISSDGDHKGSNIVGDVNIEYEINEDGTFTVNVFNQSNDDAASQDQGPFTQGVGLSYQETFNSRKDFKLWQGFLDIFRKEKQREKKQNSNGRKVSVEDHFTPVTYSP